MGRSTEGAGGIDSASETVSLYPEMMLGDAKQAAKGEKISMVLANGVPCMLQY